MDIHGKRIHEEVADADGTRVLVDRVWPRGIAKERAALDLWAKAVTPSSELRTWYHEDREGRWEEFRERYVRELTGDDEAEEQLTELRRVARDGRLTLLTAVKEPEHSHVAVLIDVLRNGLPRG